MHYDPLAYIRSEGGHLEVCQRLISNTKGEGKEGDPFWTKSETLLYCALIAHIVFRRPPPRIRNMNTLVDPDPAAWRSRKRDDDFMGARGPS